MDRRKINYTLHSGKNNKLKFFVKAYLRQCIPTLITQKSLKRALARLDSYADRDQLHRKPADDSP